MNSYFKTTVPMSNSTTQFDLAFGLAFSVLHVYAKYFAVLHCLVIVLEARCLIFDEQVKAFVLFSYN